MAKEAKVAQVSSIGVDAKGNSVVRIYVDGRRYDVATNVVGFAALAEAGLPVQNEMQRK